MAIDEAYLKALDSSWLFQDHQCEYSGKAIYIANSQLICDSDTIISILTQAGVLPDTYSFLNPAQDIESYPAPIYGGPEGRELQKLEKETND